MEEIKKRQHYVWKDYLRAWAESNDLIHTYFKQQKKTARPNLKNVAQEKFFYEAEEFTIEEQKELLEITSKLSSKSSLEACLGVLSVFFTYSEIKNQLVKNNIDLSENDIRFIQTNLIEHVHMDFEAYGRRLINVKRLEDLAFLKKKKALLHTMIYLCIQYTRTKHMRNNFYNSTYPNKFSDPISIIFAINMANILTFDENLCFTILNNQSAVNYITGDQPVINLVDINKNGSDKDFVLYYPIKPKIAIQFKLRQHKSTFEAKNIETTELVNELNSKIYQYADNLVFSDSEEQISRFVDL